MKGKNSCTEKSVKAVCNFDITSILDVVSSGSNCDWVSWWVVRRKSKLGDDQGSVTKVLHRRSFLKYSHQHHKLVTSTWLHTALSQPVTSKSPGYGLYWHHELSYFANYCLGFVVFDYIDPWPTTWSLVDKYFHSDHWLRYHECNHQPFGTSSPSTDWHFQIASVGPVDRFPSWTALQK